MNIVVRDSPANTGVNSSGSIVRVMDYFKIRYGDSAGQVTIIDRRIGSSCNIKSTDGNSVAAGLRTRNGGDIIAMIADIDLLPLNNRYCRIAR